MPIDITDFNAGLNQVRSSSQTQVRSSSQPRNGLLGGISRGPNSRGESKNIQHPMNRDLFGSPRHSAAFKSTELGMQAALEKIDGRLED